MPFQYENISYTDTGYFSSLVLDYLTGSKTLEGLYAYPANKKGMQAAIATRAKYPVDRNVLVSTITNQYDGFDVDDKVRECIQLLGKENTYTICTAHQPNLLTGYLYFIYKILHAIKLAEDLKKEYPDKNFVPVYYMGSEDNDLEELGTFKYKETKFVWDGNGQQGAVGRMNTKGLKKLFNDLFRLLGPPGDYSDNLKETITKAYLEHSTISAATRYLVNELFGRYGLVVIDPDEAAFKKAILPILKDEILHQQSHAIVTKEISRIDTQYKVQAHPRKINLFYLADNVRERIERKENEWVVVNTDKKWKEDELLTELNEHPERFSPNVILRGLLQESILPNVAFIGGGAEVAYWMQLKRLFEHYNVFYPVVLLRQSVLWVRQEQKQLMDKLGYTARDIFKPTDELVGCYVKQHSEHELQTTEEMKALEKIIKDLQQKAIAIDNTLNRSAEAVLAKVKYQLEVLQKKMLRAEKKKQQVHTDRIVRLKNNLFPNDSLQERIENFASYYAECGPGYFDVIKNGIDPFCSEFLVIENIG